MLSNLQCHVFHQTTDTKTVEYAQALLGKRCRFLMNGGKSQPEGDWVARSLGLAANGSFNAGFSEHMEYPLEASEFHRLARGGVQANFTVEGLLFQSGRSFASTGLPYLPVRFSQRVAAD